ncbi:MAG: sugar transferase [Clostridia bacterium]|nr:sugar transferase [Clostridia bacterium]
MLRKKRRREARYRVLKRTLDLVFSSLLLLFLALPMLLLAIAIRLTSRGPAIFRQLRVGRGGKLFVCLKFRTMVTDAPSNCPSAELRDGRYVTPIGRFLRRTSLDELPQLWNVLRGEMSLVGPRPLIPCEELVHTLRRRSGADRLRPGITGLSQVRGRDFLPDLDKARLDARYARTLHLGGDVRIVAETLFGVFSGKDVFSAQRASNFQK